MNAVSSPRDHLSCILRRRASGWQLPATNRREGGARIAVGGCGAARPWCGRDFRNPKARLARACLGTVGRAASQEGSLLRATCRHQQLVQAAHSSTNRRAPHSSTDRSKACERLRKRFLASSRPSVVQPLRRRAWRCGATVTLRGLCALVRERLRSTSSLYAEEAVLGVARQRSPELDVWY